MMVENWLWWHLGGGHYCPKYSAGEQKARCRIRGYRLEAKLCCFLAPCVTSGPSLLLWDESFGLSWLLSIPVQHTHRFQSVLDKCQTYQPYRQVSLWKSIATPYQWCGRIWWDGHSFSTSLFPLTLSRTFSLTTLLPFTIWVQVVTSLKFPIPLLTKGANIPKEQGLGLAPRDTKVENPVSSMEVTSKKEQQKLLALPKRLVEKQSPEKSSLSKAFWKLQCSLSDHSFFRQVGSSAISSVPPFDAVLSGLVIVAVCFGIRGLSSQASATCLNFSSASSLLSGLLSGCTWRANWW